MSPLRIAVIGCGFWSRFQIPAWHEVEGVDCVALCDVNSERCQALAARFGIAENFDDPVKLLDSVESGAIDMVTGPETHQQLVEGSEGSVELGPDYQIRLTGRYPPEQYSWADPDYALVHASIVECPRNLATALWGIRKGETTGQDNLQTLKLVCALHHALAAIFLLVGCESSPQHTAYRRYGHPPYDEADEFYRREQDGIASERDSDESPYSYPYGPPPQQTEEQDTDQAPDQPQNQPPDQVSDPDQEGEPTPNPSERSKEGYSQGTIPGTNDIPTAKPGKNGVVESPYVPGKNVDIQGYPPGATVKDPYTNKLFIVPAAPTNP